MLSLKNTAVILVDVQEKLSRVMYQREELLQNLQKLIKGSRVLGVPILWVEQNPEGLGPTVSEIADLLTDRQPIRKLSFSCCGSHQFVQALKKLKCKQILITGIETHVCVHQTAMDLLSLGYEVQIVADAVSSRTPENRQIGLEKMRNAGSTLTSTEMALFELLRVAEGPKFKEILKIVK